MQGGIMFENSTLHGYNPVYRYSDTVPETRFTAFSLSPHRPMPERFHFQPVAGTNYLDHQGHIISQTIYQGRLEQIAGQVDQQLFGTPHYTLAGVNTFLVQNFPGLNFQAVTDYIALVLQGHGGAQEHIFVDHEGTDLEDRVGGYFSVINWNPVNICRAPTDEYRNGYPANAPDQQVVNKLLATPNAPGITLHPTFMAFLQANLQNLGGNVDAFLTAANACLGNNPVGFYAFDWSVHPV
jgi:hypothetical protein